MSSNDSWTIGRLLQWTAAYLNEHGSDSGRLDAEVLLSHARGCERIELYTAFDQEPSEEERSEFRKLVRLRAEGTPVAYLVGYREFYSLAFKVTPDVLIPRPETEFLVIAVQDLMKQQASNDADGREWRIADVGTGSGIIAICLARLAELSHIWAIDRSAAALEVATENCRKHDVADRVEFVQGDLLGPISDGLKLDFVVSNPPYVSEAEYADLAPTVKAFEPQLALVAGPEGTEIIERLVSQSAGHLVSGGWLLLEISPMIEQRVHEMLQQNGQFDQPETIPDLAGFARVVRTRRI